MRACVLAIGLLLAAAPAWAFAPRGGNAAPHCGPDAAPTPAAEVGFNCQVFDATFTSLSATDPATGNTLVDINNTLNPGYDFYLFTYWPYAIWPNWGQETTPMPTNAYSITTALGCGTGSDNVVQGICLEPQGNTFYTMLSCVHTNPVTAAGWTGNVWTGGYYMDVNASWADNGTSPNPAYPSIYTIPLEFYVGNLPTSPFYTNGANAHVSEKDLLDERFTGGTIDWTFAVGSSTRVAQYNSTMTANVGPTYGMLVQPQAWNVGSPGYGSIQFYSNDTPDSTGPLLFKTGALPNPDTANVAYPDSTPPAGTWSTEDTDHDCVVLNGGTGAPIFITSVKVWQRMP